MDDSRAARMVQAALRCYPARWRRRHGDEAAELAALLVRDGTSAGSIAWSYLAGAAREWLTPHPGRRLSTVAGVALAAVCLLGVSVGMLASAGPARAASTSQAHGHGRAASMRQAAGHGRAASTGQARGHSQCRPGSPQAVPGSLPAAGRPRVIIGVAGRGHSC
jgi:hypothetical protein